jgi:hypothetical protein
MITNFPLYVKPFLPEGFSVQRKTEFHQMGEKFLIDFAHHLRGPKSSLIGGFGLLCFCPITAFFCIIILGIQTPQPAGELRRWTSRK